MLAEEGAQDLLAIAAAIARMLDDPGLPCPGADRRFVLPEQLRNVHVAQFIAAPREVTEGALRYLRENGCYDA